MIKIFAGEFGVSSDVVEDLVVVNGLNPDRYQWVHCDTGNSWLVPRQYLYLAEYVDGYASHTGIDYDDGSECDETWDADGAMYYVHKAVLDTDDSGDIEIYLAVHE